jgi:hypothetical protein
MVIFNQKTCHGKSLPLHEVSIVDSSTSWVLHLVSLSPKMVLKRGILEDLQILNT